MSTSKEEQQPKIRPLQGADQPDSKRARIESKDTESATSQGDTTDIITGLPPVYLFEHGLRKVQPYFHNYKTFAKGRWLGKTLYEVFCREFRDQEPSYYRMAIGKGLIRVKDKPALEDYVIKNGDSITHYIHRHEPPVTEQEIVIVHRDDAKGILVIDKPASIPVHPSGRYQHNTVVNILESSASLGIAKLYPVNRLDRLTSGLMLLGTNKEAAQRLEVDMRGRRIHKVYLARVTGEFPQDKIQCKAPIRTVAHKLGLNTVDEEGGKECETHFERISYNGRTSLVRCLPKTGRTHQIRVHLLHLGHPIPNDPLYAHPKVQALSRAGESGSVEKTVADLLAEGVHNPTDSISLPGTESHGTCEECRQVLLPDPVPEAMCIWLHALEYAQDVGDGEEAEWSFKTSPPAWTKEDFFGDEVYAKK